MGRQEQESSCEKNVGGHCGFFSNCLVQRTPCSTAQSQQTPHEAGIKSPTYRTTSTAPPLGKVQGWPQSQTGCRQAAERAGQVFLCPPTTPCSSSPSHPNHGRSMVHGHLCLTSGNAGGGAMRGKTAPWTHQGHGQDKVHPATSEKGLSRRKWCSPFTASGTKAAAFTQSMLHKRLLLYVSLLCNRVTPPPLERNRQQ